MAKKRNKKNNNNENKSALISYGNLVLPPVIPGPEVDDICKKIDKFYSKYPKQHKTQKTSDLIKGAFYAMRPECKSNTDWMSQAANSAREVLYPLFSESISTNNLIKLFKKYAKSEQDRRKIKNQDFINTFDALDEIYKKLSDLTHHGTDLRVFSQKEFSNFSEKDFENLMKDFTTTLRRSFNLQQIYIHTIIDAIVEKKNKSNGLKEDLKLILNVNPDARQYFYSKINEFWLKWLWNEGFLGVINEKSEDPTSSGYRTPELNCLVRLAEKAPDKVTNIMTKVTISLETFNPEVIDQFLQVYSTLPSHQLSRVIKKILDEKWIPLMGAFNQWGFQYEKMFKTLSNSKDYNNLIILAEAVLTVRTKEEIERKPSRGLIDNPFYFDDLSYTKVFEHLADVGDEYTEKALGLATGVMAQIITLWSKEDEGEDDGEKVFNVYDKFTLYDVDFFDLRLGQKDHLSPRDDVRELAAVIKILVNRLIGEQCVESDKIKRILKSLPDSMAMWRLRLYVLSLCPDTFKSELKKAFFRLFKVPRYHEIMSGTEYLNTLQKGFSSLTEEDKQKFVNQTIEFFCQKRENEHEQGWYKRDGSMILSMILPYLNKKPELNRKAVEAGFTFDPSYKPEPSIGRMRGGTVVPRGPISQEEFGDLALAEITKKLRDEWAPEKLAKQNKSDDFLNPLNAEGAGELLRNDILKRLQEYVDNAPSFFERNVLAQHYTYSYLRGIQEAIKNHREKTLKINWSGVIAFCTEIKESGQKKPFAQEKKERDSFDAWLADSNAVHSAMTDVLQELLAEKDGSTLIDFGKYRGVIFAILEYLLSYPDPTPADEHIETTKSKTKSPNDVDYMVSDPFTMAINTVRGRAYQAFVLFVYDESKQFKKDDKVKISDDAKKLYEDILKREHTRALMFMFGHYLPSFYFRDRNWMQNLLPQIFPQEPERKHLYTAAWEGYLANSLYEEIFFDPKIQKLYELSLNSNDLGHPKQKQFRDPDEGIAVHLALAYIHYEKFGFGHVLFDAFWNKNDPEQHANFVSFLGRSFVSGENANANELLKKNPKSKKRLKDFWDWMLENYKNLKPFNEFGFWINLEKNIYTPTWLVKRINKTLEKTEGSLEWNYGLTKTVVRLAKKAPKDTLKIAQLYLLEGGIRGDTRRRPLYLDNEWVEALKILYKNPETKLGTETLINELISGGGSTFHRLKDILEDN